MVCQLWCWRPTSAFHIKGKDFQILWQYYELCWWERETLLLAPACTVRLGKVHLPFRIGILAYPDDPWLHVTTESACSVAVHACVTCSRGTIRTYHWDIPNLIGATNRAQPESTAEHPTKAISITFFKFGKHIKELPMKLSHLKQLNG